MGIDLTGRKFGQLTVIARAPQRGRHCYWLCQCACGQEKEIEQSHLTSGHTKSCGCYRKKRLLGTYRDLRGMRFGRLVVLEPVKNRDGTVRRWRCRCDCGKETVCYAGNLTRGITQSCGCLQAETRKKNLKKAIHFSEGTCVERIASRGICANNTSGHRGVYSWENGRWRASIGFKGKLYNLGTFCTYGDAVQARMRAEKEMYEPFLAEYRRKEFKPNQRIVQEEGQIKNE